MESMRKVARLTDKEDKGEETLDADLWGQLQEHIPLQCIYEKLSQRDLFKLRLVSKEWNHAALQWTLPKPSFVTIAACVNYWDEDLPLVRYLNGIVSYSTGSGKFKFNRQHLRLLDVETHVSPFEVEGLILCHNPDDLEERGVFNVHTRTWHAIPAGPEQSESKTLSACGLVVDTNVRPYTFKLIEGNLDFKTQIYDSKSRSWSRTSSRLLLSYAAWWDTLEYSCICHNKNVYMSRGTHMIWKEDDNWTKLESPTLKNSVGRRPPENTLGIWEGRIFTTRERYLKERVTVWELVNFKGQEWVEYARMPKELYEWVWKCDIDVVGRHMQVGLRSFFCDGYLLVCCWRWDRAFADAFAVFDIATKIWRKVDLPKRTVAIDEQEYESSHEGQDVDEDEDDDEVYYVGERVHVPDLFHENVDEDEDTDEDDHVDEYELVYDER